MSCFSSMCTLFPLPDISAWPIPACPSRPISDATSPLKPSSGPPGPCDPYFLHTLIILCSLLTRSSYNFSWGITCVSQNSHKQWTITLIIANVKHRRKQVLTGWVTCPRSSAGSGEQDIKVNNPRFKTRLIPPCTGYIIFVSEFSATSWSAWGHTPFLFEWEQGYLGSIK